MTLNAEAPRRCGRPRLPSPERRARARASKKAWAERNYDYVRAQIKALAARPEYLERRRFLRHARQRQATQAAFIQSSDEQKNLYTLQTQLSDDAVAQSQ